MQDARVGLELDITEFKRRLAEVEVQMQGFGEKLGGIEKATAVQAIGAITDGIRNIGDRISDVSPAMGRFITDVTDIGTSAAQAGAMFGPLGAAVAGIGTALAIVSTEMVGFLQGSVSLAGDFEAGMANVSTLVDTSVVSIKELSKGLLELSPDVIKSTDDLTGGLYQVISAGIQASDSLDVLRVAAIAATAGLSTTEVSVDGLTSVLNSYHLTAESATSVADMMFKAVEKGKLTFDEIAGSIGNVTGIASTLGVGFDELLAVITTLTTGSTKFAESTTAVRQLLTEMIEPSEKALEAAEDLGIEFSAAALSSKGLVGFLTELREKAEGNPIALGKLISSVEALNAVMNLTSETGDKMVVIQGEIADSSGAAATAFEKQADTYNKQMELLDIQIDNLKIAIGEELLPTLTTFLQEVNTTFKDLGPTFDVLKETIQSLTPVIDAVLDNFRKSTMDLLAIFDEVPEGVWGKIRWGLGDLGKSGEFLRERKLLREQYPRLSTTELHRIIEGRSERPPLPDVGPEPSEAEGEIVAAAFRGIVEEAPVSITGGLAKGAPPVTLLDEKEIQRIEEATRKENQRTASFLASLEETQIGRELAALGARYDAEVENLNARLEAVKGASEQELRYKEALTNQLGVLDEKYLSDYARIVEKHVQVTSDAEGEVLYGRLEAYDTESEGLRITLAEQEQLRSAFAAKRLTEIEEEAAFAEMIMEKTLAVELRTDAEIARNAERYREEEKKRYLEAVDWVTAKQEERIDKIRDISRAEAQRIFPSETIKKSDEALNEFIRTIYDAKDATTDWGSAWQSLDSVFGNVEMSIGGITTDTHTLIDVFQAFRKAVDGVELSIGDLVAVGKVWQDVWSGIGPEFEKGPQEAEILGTVQEQYLYLLEKYERNEEELKRVRRIYAQYMTYSAGGIISPTPEDLEWWKQKVAERGPGEGREIRLEEGPIGRARRRRVEFEEEEEKQRGGGVTISQITGPTRDLLVDLLMPIRNLNILPSLMEAMTRAIYEMRDAFLGGKTPPIIVPGIVDNGNAGVVQANGGQIDDVADNHLRDNINIETVNVNVAQAADVADIDNLDRELSNAARRQKRLLGRKR